ncbi:UPF0029-domain-containing protein [Moesziomyces antarcticus]|uniref:UPF0029-domain-containing protein n=2 Tax=Pseudozyma antarctica TaxID=84753 RepID=A0A081CF93_PSEA2|nr:UPF0029-domain-containing protein [Moesziomyces antarcticus]GAK65339.1 UPF0029-domain-containing protein [Moesziomyces antarcticus]SPO46344.1 related to YIH1 [Moesziomyces antarcticus]
MDDDASGSVLSALIARIEAYAADPSSLSVPGSTTRHALWLADEAQRIEAATQLAEELVALQSIYTDDAIFVLKISPLGAETRPNVDDADGHEDAADPNTWLPGAKLTLSISADVEAQTTDGEPIPIRLAVTLPPFYPHSARPPQLQLLSRYVGGFSVDARLFGEILRAFYHQTGDSAEPVDAEEAASAKWIGGSMDRGVDWASGQVVLFEGIEWVKEKVSDWWTDKETERVKSAPSPSSQLPTATASDPQVTTFAEVPTQGQPAPFEGTIFRTESIIERKSEFIGHAASITSPDQVASVLSRIVSDKRVARATHPIINAWVCRGADGVVHRDCDDDGETAAGGRLAHLLSILELENVLVVVTRWYGGVHLGPDRFKLINRAARDALDLAGLVGKNTDDTAKTKGMGKRNA